MWVPQRVELSFADGCWIHAIQLATIIYSMAITEYTPFLTLIHQVTPTSLQTASAWNHLRGYQYFGQEKHYFFQFVISEPLKSLLAHWVLSYEWFSEACDKPHLQNRLIMKRSLRLNCYSVNTFYGYHLESVSNPPRFRCNDAYLSDCASTYSKRKPNRRSTQSATVAKTLFGSVWRDACKPKMVRLGLGNRRSPNFDKPCADL